MKAGLALGMLALRALGETGTGVARPRHVPRDQRRGDRQRLVAIRDRGRGAAQRGRAGARAVAAGRRAEDQPEGLRRVRRCASTGVPAHAGIEPEKGASAIHELARQILAIEALQDLARGTTLNVGVIARRHADQRRRRRGRGRRRRARRDDGRGGAGRRRDGRPAAPRSRARACRSPAASTGRRSSARRASSGCSPRAGGGRRTGATTWAKARPAEGRTETSRPRSASQH